MTTHPTETPEGSKAYEERDVAFRPVLVTAAVLVALCLGTVGFMSVVERALVAREVARNTPPNPLATTYGRRESPAPRLQDHPRRDLAALQERDRQLIEGYGWVDRGAGRVRIPVERAMELLVAEGGTP